jgi:hypothetical protein
VAVLTGAFAIGGPRFSRLRHVMGTRPFILQLATRNSQLVQMLSHPLGTRIVRSAAFLQDRERPLETQLRVIQPHRSAGSAGTVA